MQDTPAAGLYCDICGKGPFKHPLGLRGHLNSKGHPGYEATNATRQATLDAQAEEIAAEAEEIAAREALLTAEAQREADENPIPPLEPLEPETGMPFVSSVMANVEPPAPPVDTSPAILRDWRAKPLEEITHGHRSVTMLRPICRECERLENRPRFWMRDCPHDPYVTMVPHNETIVDWADEMRPGPDGLMQPTGRRYVVKGSEREYVSYTPRPNHVNISWTPAAHGGHGLSMARWKGYIFPSELRSPHYPYGIANTCEWHDCRQQVGLKQYETGVYCRPEEAALAYFHLSGTPLEVGNPDSTYSINARNEQMANAPVGVGVPVA